MNDFLNCCDFFVYLTEFLWPQNNKIEMVTFVN